MANELSSIQSAVSGGALASSTPSARAAEQKSASSPSQSVELVSNDSVKVQQVSFEDQMDLINQAIEELNKVLVEKNHSIQFRMDETLDRSIITVVDKNTGEVVRQLPSDEMIRVAHNLESLKGILVKEWV